jgi:hypothetical protein
MLRKQSRAARSAEGQFVRKNYDEALTNNRISARQKRPPISGHSSVSNTSQGDS